MKKRETECFGVVDEPESARELIDTILWNDPSPDEGGWIWPRIWRGQPDISWPLHSSAYRRLTKHRRPWERGPVNDKDMANYEKRLLEGATHRGFRHRDGRELGDMELLALLRHHGAATRLVDATRNGLIGCWFAVSSLPRTTGALVGIHSHSLGGSEGRPARGDYDTVMGALAKHPHPQTWEPSAVTPRVAAQHSQFLYSAISDAVSGSLWLSATEGATWVLAISPKVKREMLAVLTNVFDIRAQTLFPDLEGFGATQSIDYDHWEDQRW